MSKNTRSPLFSLDDRFEHGALTILEVCALAKVGRTKIYADIAKGKLTVRKIGRKSIVPGPSARAYIQGEPVASSAEA